MAKKDETKSEAGAGSGKAAEGMSKKEAAVLFKGETVRLPVKGKNGEAVVQEVELSAEHILALREDDRIVRIVTVDGRKLEAEK